jgi:hypothetical protein
MAMTRFQMLATAALVSVLFLIFVGAIVRVTGSGMGCPDWPTCWGCLIPPTSADEVDFEKLPIEKFQRKAERMGRDLGQNIVVDNKPGAGGTIASSALVRAPADGYTIQLGHVGQFSIGQHQMKQPPVDPLVQFAPLGQIGNAPLALFVPATSAATTAAEFVAMARSKPGGLTYGSGGPGQINAVGVGEGPFAGHLQKGMDLSVDRVNARQTAFGQLSGRDLPLAQPLAPFSDAHRPFASRGWTLSASPASAQAQIRRRSLAVDGEGFAAAGAQDPVLEQARSFDLQIAQKGR